MVIKNLKPLIGENILDCPHHMTLKPVALKDQGSMNGFNSSTWSPTCHAMDNVLWSTGFCVKLMSKRLWV